MNFEKHIAGVDEAGRGPLAGPVIAAAVILNHPLAGIADSKKLSAKRREELAMLIKESAVAWGIAGATVAEIDKLNILQATFLAMRRAVFQLQVTPAKVLIDGNRCPELPFSSEAVVKGDEKNQSIAAASILAKVERDRLLLELHERYPVYGFDQHKGYPTKSHLASLRQHGVSPVHRRSYAPVRTVLATLGNQ